MIIQCEQCQTRFRLADEKIKPTGTKVRCSKCKHVFTVLPPEPEPAEEAVDFDAMNMEAVPEPPAEEADSPAAAEREEPEVPSAATEQTEPSAGAESLATQAASEPAATHAEPGTGEHMDIEDQGQESPAPAEQAEEDAEPDFSKLRDEPAATVDDSGEKTAEDFSFPPETADADLPSFDSAPREEIGGEPDDQPDTEAEDFTFGELAAEPEGAFDTDQEPEENFGFDEESRPAETGSEPERQAFSGQDDFSFSAAEDEESDAFQLDMPETTESTEDDSFGIPDEMAEFSFDEEPAAQEDESSQWQESTPPEEEGFDFDEPDFDMGSGETDAERESFAFEEPDFEDQEAGAAPKEDDLQFGEIDFQQEGDMEDQALETESDFARTSMTEETSTAEESGTRVAEDRDQPPRRHREDKPLAAPPVKRKGPFSKILLLLFLLVLALGGAAGYFYLRDGSLDVNRILERFGGQASPTAAESKISISITDTSYVNNRQAGQLLVVQGRVINNYPAPRSAITVKGVLLNAAGEPLYQQTVFCGNPLDETTLRQASYAKIEEAMNNQFGDSLANMDVAPGASIPFTVVFRDLPEDIANINVEIVGSKPGSA